MNFLWCASSCLFLVMAMNLHEGAAGGQAIGSTSQRGGLDGGDDGISIF